MASPMALPSMAGVLVASAVKGLETLSAVEDFDQGPAHRGGRTPLAPGASQKTNPL
jgi:hypothetical protein